MTSVLNNRRRVKTNKNTNTKRGMLDHKFDTIGKTNYPKTVESPSESLDITLSLSPTSNSREEEVSWSSSEGSTYYSEDEADDMDVPEQIPHVQQRPQHIPTSSDSNSASMLKLLAEHAHTRRDRKSDLWKSWFNR